MDNGASGYRRFLNGEEQAFDEIIKEYRDSLTFFINQFIHDFSAAEDIAIDVFMDLLVHPHRYHFGVSLKTYLFMLGRSRALDYIKRHKKLTLTDFSEDISKAAADFADYHSLEDAILADERKKAVHSALEQLPENMRITVHLIYFEQLSYKETAKIMKKTVKQVDNLLYRSKQTLRKILGKEEDFFL